MTSENPPRSSEDVQAATPPDEDDILGDEEIQELTRDNDSLPDMISFNTSLNVAKWRLSQ